LGKKWKKEEKMKKKWKKWEKKLIKGWKPQLPVVHARTQGSRVPTFCTTTLVRKKRGGNLVMRRTYFQSLPVRTGHVTSGHAQWSDPPRSPSNNNWAVPIYYSRYSWNIVESGAKHHNHHIYYTYDNFWSNNNVYKVQNSLEYLSMEYTISK
jgi:hypothetical protein